MPRQGVAWIWHDQLLVTCRNLTKGQSFRLPQLLQWVWANPSQSWDPINMRHKASGAVGRSRRMFA